MRVFWRIQAMGSPKRVRKAVEKEKRKVGRMCPD